MRRAHKILKKKTIKDFPSHLNALIQEPNMETTLHVNPPPKKNNNPILDSREGDVNHTKGVHGLALEPTIMDPHISSTLETWKKIPCPKYKKMDVANESNISDVGQK